MKKILKADFLIPVVVAFVLSLTAVFFPPYAGFKMGFFDLFLHLKPGVPESKQIVIAAIDDPTIDKLNMYPLTRNYIAQGLLTLAELGARVTAVDSEFINASQSGIKKSYLKETLPGEVTQSFEGITQGATQFLEAIFSGSMSNQEIKSNFQSFKADSETQAKILIEKVNKVEQDHDVFLGRAAKVAGHVYSTITPVAPGTESQYKVPDELKNYILKTKALNNVTIINGQTSPFPKTKQINPTILPIMEGMAGAGTVEQVVDQGGVRRRVDLIFEYEGKLFPHMAFGALLDWLGNPPIEIYSDRIVLKNAKHPEKGIMDMTIPVTHDGRLLLNWVPKRFADSFIQMPYYQILNDQERLEKIIFELKEFQKYPWYYMIQAQVEEVLRNWELSESLSNVSKPADLNLEQYRTLRTNIIKNSNEIFSKENQQLIEAEYDTFLASTKDPKEKEFGQSNKNEVTKLFTTGRDRVEEILLYRKEITDIIDQKYVVIGYSGKSTTDIGITPFDSEYINVGTMANVVNTILQGQFFQETPWWLSFFFTLPFLFIFAQLMQKMSPTRGAFLGIGGILAVTLIFLIIFGFTGYYLDATLSLLMMGISFLGILMLNFRRANSQKAYIRDAFGQYLSNEVIDELLEDPEKLKLGGEKREMTAIFTDIKGFSTISEKLDAQELVLLLNEYLSAMSDIILNDRGTIDKYEGDAIIAFFGAPVLLNDHAIRACRSAIAMKKTEVALNDQFLERKMTPNLLYTRIGINTGDMVVGNMGTERKKNYTIMGNAVNLAARLEGVNKIYQTGILISETTYNQLNGQFTTRMLDRVRVVGISTPLRLYELVDEKAITPDHVAEKINAFEKGLIFYEQKEFKRASDIFLDVLKRTPWDGPTQFYYQKCLDYIKNPPAKDWDGVMNMVTK